MCCRHLVKTFADASMAAEADVLCGPAVAYRCHNGVETAVEHSRKGSAVVRRSLGGVETARGTAVNIRISCTAVSVALRQRRSAAGTDNRAGAVPATLEGWIGAGCRASVSGRCPVCPVCVAGRLGVPDQAGWAAAAGSRVTPAGMELIKAVGISAAVAGL
jgi:hypothetical protein